MKKLLPFIAILFAIPCSAQKTFIGKIVTYDKQLNQIIEPTAQIEVVGSGMDWSEGPVWVKKGKYLLCSDTRKNVIFKWKEGEGLSTFLKPSGYTGTVRYSKEPGSNGLIINKKGELVACEHGDRRISVMSLKKGGKQTIADNYQGKRFNSPNDIVQKSNGDYYFTDPSYGLPDDSIKTVTVRGVYRISTSGTVTLLIHDLTPNGIAFSPDEKILYVGQSLPEKAIIMQYPVNADGTLGKGKLFFDATYLVKTGLTGVPDGMKVDKKGNLFTTGPGGILIITPAGKLLGRIDTTLPTSNCNWGDDGSTLYITASGKLCRVKTKTVGVGF
ncbi:MAG TPA: SMP-30/gluconolactonase/LRE family protein [Mucilaginibacter sp.]|jgi:gluconolactonase